MPKAQQTELKQTLERSFCEQVIGIRQRRRLVEELWLRTRRAWMNLDTQDGRKPPDSSSNSYSTPAMRRAVERTIVRGVKILTPKVKWFEASPMNDISQVMLDNVDKYMWYILRKKIKSRTNINMLVRCMVMFGMCHLKTSVRVMQGQVWPFQRVLDPFSYYIFPETASSSEQIEIQFEDYMLSYQQYNALSKRGFLDVINPRDLSHPEWPYHLVERLAYQGITDPTSDVQKQIDQTKEQLINLGGNFVSMTELWYPRDDKLYQVYIAWNLKNRRGSNGNIVGFFESDYDQALIRSVIHRPLPNETYTHSMGDDVTELSGLQNALMNQFLDTVDYEQGFVGVNEQEVSRTDSLKVRGRAKWEMKGDPKQAIAMFSPNVTSVGQLRAWQIVQGYINSLAGTGTIAEGQPGRNMPRAGFAVDNLITLGMADITDVSELIEQEALTPSLGDIYAVTKFMPDSQLIRIPGGKGVLGSIFKKRDIINGQYEFEWIGSLQGQDDAQNAQRMMIFLNMVPQLEPLIQRQGYTINIVELLRFIWRDSLGNRGLRDIVVPVQQFQQDVEHDLQEELSDSQDDSNAGHQYTPMAGLKYNLPTLTNGFVRQ